jgi:multisubunit Na+/H+ antiporter MnhG subunit
MTMHAIILDVLLGLVVVSSWVGVLGMVRMRTPLQALHYLTLPATAGMIFLFAAVYFDAGFNANTVKVLVIAVVFLAINSVVTHASGRAFRTRELGHWQPRDGDPIEFVPSTHHPAQPKNVTEAQP